MYIIALSVITGALGLYYFFFKNVNYFKKRGIPYKLSMPIMGNLGPMVFRLQSLAEFCNETYNLHPEAKYVGFFDMNAPAIMIRDPELIKSIAIKHCDMFPDKLVTEYQDQLFDSELIDSEYDMETEPHRTPIQSFYAGQSIFITGGTGSIGKVLIEKLLRSCPDISMIYLLIRSKKDQCPENRLDKMFEIPLYNRVKKEVPNFRKKVVPIVGNIEIENLGLSENDKNMLINKVSIIFHVAANVRFNETIKIATIANINATATVLQLAKHILNLKSFIHVSTIYSNCHMEHIEERFYSYPINHKDLITLTRNLPENIIEKQISKIISQWPNTYTFTKAITEGLVRNEGRDLPIGIFRPAIVLSSASEPLVGWVDSTYGPTGLSIAFLLGITRFQRCNPNVKANIVPVDFTVNALITSAWDVFNQHGRSKDTLVYNFVSPVDGPTWNEFICTLLNTNKIYPLRDVKYLPLMVLLSQKIPYRICVWFFHFLPALLMDVANICMGRKPRMWKLHKKIDNASKFIQPFCIKDWGYSTDNVQTMWDHLSEKDQQLFKFNMMGFNWRKYLIDYYKGIRLYLHNEDDSMLNVSRIKYRRLYWIHQILKAIIAFIALWIIWIMFRKIFTF